MMAVGEDGVRSVLPLWLEPEYYAGSSKPTRKNLSMEKPVFVVTF